jgi:queuine tRNA-ribosyltransferase
VKANEMLGAILLTTINLAYYQQLMAGLRAAIAAGGLATFRQEAKEGWARGDLPPL